MIQCQRNMLMLRSVKRLNSFIVYEIGAEVQDALRQKKALFNKLIFFVKQAQRLFISKVQTYAYSYKRNNKKEQRRTASLTCTEHICKNVFILLCHYRLTYEFYHKASKKISQRNGKKLQRISDGINPSLYIFRNFKTQNRFHIGAHKRYCNPAEKSADTPYQCVVSQSEQQVFRTH